MSLQAGNSLWLRVAALRGIQILERGERAYVEGERFQVQVASLSGRRAAEVERVSRLVNDPACRGVIGEIVATPTGPERRTRIPTSRGIGVTSLDWRRALIEREAERLAHQQPDRRSP